MWKIILIAILLYIVNPAFAGFGIFQVSGTTTVFSTLKIGAGGFLRNIDIQCDQGVAQCNNTGTTTKVARADVYGAYWFNPSTTNCGNAAATGCWQELVTLSSFPDASLLFNGCFSNCGVYEIVIAPTNTAHFYMYHGDGYIYSTTNHGTTWTRTGFANVSVNANDQVVNSFGPYMAVDPANESVVVTATPASGAFYSTNGGTSWTQISGLCTPSVPAGGAQAGGYLFAFDPTSSVSGTQTQGVYLSCYGTGVYHSTTGLGGTFTLTTSTPTTHASMTIDSAGTLYLVSGADNSINWYDGTWHSKSVGTNGGGNLQAVSVDPSSTSKIVAVSLAGRTSYTTTGPNGTWSGYTNPPSRIATDIPWLANTKESAFMSSSNIKYDPAQSNVAYLAEGIGIWYASPASGSSITWTSQSAAIEELVSNWAISPPSGTPFFQFFDRNGFQPVSSGTIYPTHHSISDNTATSIVEGWSADWCTSVPGTIVETAYGNNDGGNYSGINASGGTYNAWTLFSALGTPPASGSLSSAIACRTPSNIVWILGGTGGVFYTADGGATWTRSVTGLADADNGWRGSAGRQSRQNIVADRVSASTFYAYNSGSAGPGVYRSTDGGANFSKVVTGHISAGDGVALQMRSVPGNAGNFYITPGNSSPAQGYSFFECTDSGSVACPAVANVTDVWSFGFGAAKPGGSGYPTIFIFGKVNGTWGLWRSDDHHTTWTQVAGQYVNSSLDMIKVVEGDANTYGTVYVGFEGSGFAIGSLH